MCGGCKPGIAHVDLSKAAFQKLFSLDVGYVSPLSLIPIHCSFRPDASEADRRFLFHDTHSKVGDIEVSTLSGPPFKEWTNELKALYGPQLL